MGSLERISRKVIMLKQDMMLKMRSIPWLSNLAMDVWNNGNRQTLFTIQDKFIEEVVKCMSVVCDLN